MTKSISGDVKIDSLLDSDANLDHPVLSWQTSNSLGTNVDLTFEFMTSMPPGIQESGFSQMNAAQKSAMRDILDMIETFAAITFTERNANLENDIGFGMAALQADGFNTVGIAYQTFQFASSHRFLIESSVFLTNDVNGQDYNAPVPNGEAYSVLIHEAAHALGLDHPFEGITLPSSLDNTRYTIMSYTDGFVGQSEEPSTLMPYDIAALQYLYGRNNSHNAGDTVHDLSVFSDGSIQTIWDASGTDTLSLANVNSAGDINENGLTNAHRLAKSTLVQKYFCTNPRPLRTLSVVHSQTSSQETKPTMMFSTKVGMTASNLPVATTMSGLEAELTTSMAALVRTIFLTTTAQTE
jgi:hypothetical protein